MGLGQGFSFALDRDDVGARRIPEPPLTRLAKLLHSFCKSDHQRRWIDR